MRPNLHQLPVSGNSSGFRMPGAGRPRCNEWIRLAPALIAAMGLAHGKARADPGGPVVVGGDLVRVEAQVREGRLVERYLARRDGEWILVAAGEEGGTMGPTAAISADHEVEAGALARIGKDGADLVEEFTAGGLRVLRGGAVDGGGAGVHVTTRLNPGRPAKLHAFVDRFRFPLAPDWSFAPSVRGFVPAAQYKAPLILVQAGWVAFGIVPDVAGLDRPALKRCNHALDLDVPGGPVLSVGFVPARLAYHSVYAPDEARSWTAEGPLGNAYYLLVTAAARPGEAYREAVRLHWARFGRAGQALAAAQQAATDPHYLGLALWDDWRKAAWQVQSRAEWLTGPPSGGPARRRGRCSRGRNGSRCRFPAARRAAAWLRAAGGRVPRCTFRPGSTPCGPRMAWPCTRAGRATGSCSGWRGKPWTWRSRRRAAAGPSSASRCRAARAGRPCGRPATEAGTAPRRVSWATT